MNNEEKQRQIIKITDENGLEREAEVLLFFKNNDNNKDYLVYTFNESAGDDLVTIHASTVETNPDGSYNLLGIDDDNEWAKVKEVMRDVIKENKSSEE